MTDKNKVYLGNPIMVYRGVTITDRPYGDTPFTFVHEGEIVPHSDTRGLEDAMETIDIILDEVEEDEREPKPDWQENLARLKKWDKAMEDFFDHMTAIEPKRINYELVGDYDRACAEHKAKFERDLPKKPMLIGSR